MSNVNLDNLIGSPNLNAKYSKVSSYFAHFRVELDQAKMKLLIVAIILIVSGFSSVISQKYMAEILAISGFELKNPPVPSLSSFLSDFLGNSSLYILIIILFGMGTFSNELDVNKQVYFTLSRPISRSGYFLTRSLVLTLGIAFTTILGSFIVYYYALEFFSPIPLETITLIFLIVCLQYSCMYALMIMFSTKYSQSTAGVLGFITFLSEALIAFIEPLKWFSPLALSNDWMKMFNKNISPFDISLDFLAMIIWIIVPLLIGWIIYQKRDL